MSKITITINTDGDAFHPNPGWEIARILRALAYDYKAGHIVRTPCDINGKIVGTVEVTG